MFYEIPSVARDPYGLGDLNRKRLANQAALAVRALCKLQSGLRRHQAASSLEIWIPRSRSGLQKEVNLFSTNRR
jgi:hypothetical protein